jgi:hypothetical protein
MEWKQAMDHKSILLKQASHKQEFKNLENILTRKTKITL